MSLMYVNSKRSFLDMIRIPKKLRLKNCLCRVRSSFYCIMFILWIIDTAVLIKFIIMFAEMAIYSEDYPWMVKLDIIVKALLQICLVLVEGIFIIKNKQFQFCKATYGIKFLQILFVLF